jgi:hypothetical protein
MPTAGLNRSAACRLGSAAFVACAVAVAGPASAQPETSPAPSAASAAAVTPPGAASASAASAATGGDPDLSLSAYRQALSERRLDAGGPLGTEQLGAVIRVAEEHLAIGRRDEAIAVLASVVESERFAPLARLEEGRAALFLLGDALERAGAHALARSYLTRLIEPPQNDGWLRRAVARLVDIGLDSSDPTPIVELLRRLPSSPDAAWAGDVAYLEGILHERAGRPREALQAHARVPERSRFWSQATYRAGLLEVEQGRLGAGERLFCRVADPKQTPRLAPLVGGNAFFEIRDLARLALGRVAHEQYRFDDARYYYHLVPGDSERLSEALYESATSRYEAKDYAGARDLLGELGALGGHHAYEDEAYILDAYVDLARCDFPRADGKLRAFLARYEPVLLAARQLSEDPAALHALIANAPDAAASAAGSSRDVMDMLRTSIRLDPSYARLTRQLAELEQQLGGLQAARSELASLATGLDGKVAARPVLALADSPADRSSRVAEQLAAVRRSLRDASRNTAAPQAELAAIRRELGALEADAARLGAEVGATLTPPPAGPGLPDLLARDAALASELDEAARERLVELEAQRDALAKQAVARLERRLARLVRRARAGRIETVLGRKHALEVEVEALSQGFLPQGAVDSLDAARYLSDDEEYWPFDGEDWEDEYIGGEGLR